MFFFLLRFCYCCYFLALFSQAFRLILNGKWYLKQIMLIHWIYALWFERKCRQRRTKAAVKEKITRITMTSHKVRALLVAAIALIQTLERNEGIKHFLFVTGSITHFSYSNHILLSDITFGHKICIFLFVFCRFFVFAIILLGNCRWKVD